MSGIAAGIDYGVSRIAIAIPQTNEYHEYVLSPGDNNKALTVLFEIVQNVLVHTHAEVVAIEAPIQGMSRNVRVGISLAMVAGAISVAAQQCGSHVDIVPPASWKKTVLGVGNANKDQIKSYLEENHKALYSNCLSQDMVDATCIALYAQTLVAGESGLLGNAL